MTASQPRAEAEQAAATRILLENVSKSYEVGEGRVTALDDVSLRVDEAHFVVILGPSGCGKTSTAAALINMVNQTRTDHIITLEDPVEYVFKNQRALINQRQIGRDVDTYPTALKGALRQDPDVILVGALRDLETTRLAVTAAETGHLVFGTLHTNSAAETVDRLIDVFPHEQQAQVRTMVSTALKAVVSQMLLKRALASAAGASGGRRCRTARSCT